MRVEQRLDGTIGVRFQAQYVSVRRCARRSENSRNSPRQRGKRSSRQLPEPDNSRANGTGQFTCQRQRERDDQDVDPNCAVR